MATASASTLREAADWGDDSNSDWTTGGEPQMGMGNPDASGAGLAPLGKHGKVADEVLGAAHYHHRASSLALAACAYAPRIPFFLTVSPF